MTQTTLTRQDVEGTWTLLDWVQTYDDGRVVRPFGEQVTGFITYCGDRMSALITKADRPAFVTGGQWNADVAEKACAYDETLAYAGRFTIGAGTLTHHVEASLFPNWVGADQIRHVVLEAGTLRLDARLEEGTDQARTASLVWRRLAPAG